MSLTRIVRLVPIVAAAAALAACGGGGEEAAGTTGGVGGTLTLSAATPATHNTTVDLATANHGNDARAADAFSAAAYCELYWEGAKGANGKTYALQVYFRQTDKAALHVSVMEVAAAGPAPWVAFQNNAGNPISGITVDTATRTLSFASKAITGSAGEAVTLSGSTSFAANAGTPACGA